MSRLTTPPPRPSVPTVTAERVQFAGRGDTGVVRIARTFNDPRIAYALASPIDVATASTESTADLVILTCAGRTHVPAGWLERPKGDDEAVEASDVEVDGGRLRWRPGRAVLEGRVVRADDVRAAVIEFAFYEGELRRLEESLKPYETSAAADVPFVYDVNDSGRPHWARFKQTIEALATLRLTFARLEPRLGRASRALPLAGRRAFNRLLVRAHVEDRLEAFSDRLEACEDLYEGAVDRITDHRWWKDGHRLEVLIVGLLGIEAVMMAAELWMLSHGR